MGLWMLGLPLSQPEADFATTARNMQALYGQDLTVDKSPMFEWYHGFSARMAQLFGSPMSDNVPPPTQPQLSSIGLVDGRVKTRYEGKVIVDVETVEPIVDMMVPQIAIYQWYEYFGFFPALIFPPLASTQPIFLNAEGYPLEAHMIINNPPPPSFLKHVSLRTNSDTNRNLKFGRSFKGIWYMNACYNESNYSEVYVEEFLKRVKATLFQNLEISEQAQLYHK